MNPDTNELTRARTEEELEELLDRGFLEVPEELHKAAELKLGKENSAFVSKTSGGKLSKWAAKKRRERILKEEMVKNCNDFYNKE